MGHIQQRPPHEICAEALRRAGQKLEKGCIECAEGYFELARTHGASESDVLGVIRRTQSVVANTGSLVGIESLKRRDFFKLAGTALAAGVAAQFVLPRVARASTVVAADSATFGYFGVDSCTSPEVGGVAGMPLHFYIAQLGATKNGLGCFDPRTSLAVGQDYTHGYWGLCGPNFAPPLATRSTSLPPPSAISGAAASTTSPPPSAPSATSPLLAADSPYAAFGVAQAQAAIIAWNNTPGVAGTTIFADIEAGFGGWGDPMTQQQCVELLDGFLVTIAAAGFVPGVYIANWARDTWFPKTYRAAVPFVYWMAGGPASGTMCGPCEHGCDTLAPVATLWAKEVQVETFAGMSAILWQYWPSDCGCGGDFNFSPQNGHKAFIPGPVPRQ